VQFFALRREQRKVRFRAADITGENEFSMSHDFFFTAEAQRTQSKEFFV
jgi:hypothetical protein